MSNVVDGNQDNETYKQLTSDRQYPSLEDVLGPRDKHILNAAIPLSLGGDSDIYIFRSHIQGVTYVTADLLGDAGDEQVPSKVGKYGLMICTKQESSWAANLIARLARFSLEEQLNPGETMDLGPFTTDKLEGILFCQPDLSTNYFTETGHTRTLLLCVGITESELEVCKTKGSVLVLKLLREKLIFPYTDSERTSLL